MSRVLRGNSQPTKVGLRPEPLSTCTVPISWTEVKRPVGSSDSTRVVCSCCRPAISILWSLLPQEESWAKSPEGIQK